MNMRCIVLLGLALAGCRSFGSDIAELQAEIVRLEREMPPESPLWIADGPHAFDKYLDDYTVRVPDFIYNHLVRKLATVSYEVTTAQSQGIFPLEAAFRDPASRRGRFWKIRGTIANLSPLRIADRDAGVEQVYSGVLVMDNRPVLFHVVDKPEFVVIGRDVVETDAVFVKILSYVARNGQRVEAPFFLGRRLGKYV